MNASGRLWIGLTGQKTNSMSVGELLPKYNHRLPGKDIHTIHTMTADHYAETLRIVYAFIFLNRGFLINQKMLTAAESYAKFMKMLGWRLDQVQREHERIKEEFQNLYPMIHTILKANPNATRDNILSTPNTALTFVEKNHSVAIYEDKHIASFMFFCETGIYPALTYPFNFPIIFDIEFQNPKPPQPSNSLNLPINYTNINSLAKPPNQTANPSRPPRKFVKTADILKVVVKQHMKQALDAGWLTGNNRTLVDSATTRDILNFNKFIKHLVNNSEDYFKRFDTRFLPQERHAIEIFLERGCSVKGITLFLPTINATYSSMGGWVAAPPKIPQTEPTWFSTAKQNRGILGKSNKVETAQRLANKLLQAQRDNKIGELCARLHRDVPQRIDYVRTYLKWFENKEKGAQLEFVLLPQANVQRRQNNMQRARQELQSRSA